MIDYKEAKKKVSIISILRDWGYKFDKSKGAISPNFVLRDEHGKEIDRVIITNPKKSEEQGYWRRDGGKGDLITFIKENLNQFGVVGRNETDTVTKVLAKLMNIEEEKQQHRKQKVSADTSEPDLFDDYEMDQWLDDNGIREAKEFDLAQWERLSGTEHINDMMNFFTSRGITQETVEDFAEFIELVKNKGQQSDGAPYPTNIGFPYRVPRSNCIVGYELRGFGGFKGKAEGTNSRSGLWLADFSGGRPSRVRKVFFFESALDAMAFYQQKQEELYLEQCVFASTGGSFSDLQVKGTMDYFARATAIDCFDNDLQGHLYGCRMIALLEGQWKMDDLKCEVKNGIVKFKFGERNMQIAAALLDIDTFRAMTGLYKNKVEEWKAPDGYKDWNDVLMKEQDS